MSELNIKLIVSTKEHKRTFPSRVPLPYNTVCPSNGWSLLWGDEMEMPQADRNVFTVNG